MNWACGNVNLTVAAYAQTQTASSSSLPKLMQRYLFNIVVVCGLSTWGVVVVYFLFDCSHFTAFPRVITSTALRTPGMFVCAHDYHAAVPTVKTAPQIAIDVASSRELISCRNGGILCCSCGDTLGHISSGCTLNQSTCCAPSSSRELLWESEVLHGRFCIPFDSSNLLWVPVFSCDHVLLIFSKG